MKVHCESHDLKLKDPFTISRGTVTVQPTLIVRVEYDDFVGLGEATTNSYYGITLESMQAAIDRVADKLASYRLENPAELWKENGLRASGLPFRTMCFGIAPSGTFMHRCMINRCGDCGVYILKMDTHQAVTRSVSTNRMSCYAK